MNSVIAINIFPYFVMNLFTDLHIKQIFLFHFLPQSLMYNASYRNTATPWCVSYRLWRRGGQDPASSPKESLSLHPVVCKRITVSSQIPGYLCYNFYLEIKYGFLEDACECQVDYNGQLCVNLVKLQYPITKSNINLGITLKVISRQNQYVQSVQAKTFTFQVQMGLIQSIRNSKTEASSHRIWT